MQKIFNAKSQRGKGVTKVVRDRSPVVAGEWQRRRQIIWASPCQQSAAGEGAPALRKRLRRMRRIHKRCSRPSDCRVRNLKPPNGAIVRGMAVNEIKAGLAPYPLRMPLASIPLITPPRAARTGFGATAARPRLAWALNADWIVQISHSGFRWSADRPEFLIGQYSLPNRSRSYFFLSQFWSLMI